jgi:hypothetical protein
MMLVKRKLPLVGPQVGGRRLRGCLGCAAAARPRWRKASIRTGRSI